MNLSRQKFTQIPKGFEPFSISIKPFSGEVMTIDGYYDDCRLSKEERAPLRDYYIYEFRESDDGTIYHATVEPRVGVNHSGTFITKHRLPFSENGNKDFFNII